MNLILNRPNRSEARLAKSIGKSKFNGIVPKSYLCRIRQTWTCPYEWSMFEGAPLGLRELTKGWERIHASTLESLLNG